MSQLPEYIDDLGKPSDRLRRNPDFDYASHPFNSDSFFVWSRIDGVTSLRDIVLMVGFPVDHTLQILVNLRACGALLRPGESPASVARRAEPAADANPVATNPVAISDRRTGPTRTATSARQSTPPASGQGTRPGGHSDATRPDGRRKTRRTDTRHPPSDRSSAAARTSPDARSPITQTHPGVRSPVTQTRPGVRSPVGKARPGAPTATGQTQPGVQPPINQTRPGVQSPVAMRRPAAEQSAGAFPDEISHPSSERPSSLSPSEGSSAPGSSADASRPDVLTINPDELDDEERGAMLMTAGLTETNQLTIIAMRRKLHVANYFDLLDVDIDADKRKVKRAYRRLSKQFHPDRYYGKKMGPFGPWLATIFETLTKAFDVLSDERLRGQYVAALQGKTPPARVGPQTQAEYAEELFERARHNEAGGNHTVALKLFAAAIRLDPRPAYLRRAALCALAAEEFADAEQYASKAKDLEPNNPSALRVLANVYRALEKLELAERTLIDALAIKSENDALLTGLQSDLAEVRSALARA